MQIDLQENYQGIENQEATRKNEESRRKNGGRNRERELTPAAEKVLCSPDHPTRHASSFLLLAS
jgi:hypothetical protein